MKKVLLFLVALPVLCHSQSKKELDHDAYNTWRRVDNKLISNDGDHVAYTTKPNGIGNHELKLVQTEGSELLSYERASQPNFTNNSNFLIFKITQDLFEKRDMQRTKVEKEDMPKDTLGIYNLSSNEMIKIVGVKSFKVPKKWDDYLVYLYDPEIDSAAKKQKKRSKKNGFDLVVRNLTNQQEYTFPYVTAYELAEEGNGISFVTTGNDSTQVPGVYSFNFQNNAFESVFRSKGEYYELTWDKKGTQLAFISDTDTTKAIQRDFQLHYWKSEWDSSKTIANNASLDNLNVNHEFDNYFSKKGNRLFFQSKELPVVSDTSLLEEEIVNVEVWHYLDKKLHTQQQNNVEDDKKLGYLSYYDVASDQIIQLGGPDFSDIKVSDEGDGMTAVALNNYPYRKQMSWAGFPIRQDIFRLDLSSGNASKVAESVKGNVSLSPKGKFAYWYEASDTAWYTYSFSEDQIRQVTTNEEVAFYNEIHDTPSDPGSYGLLSWTEDDEKMLIYDRYDIWEVDPTSKTASKRITSNGRENTLRYRYIKLDDEERFISKNQKLLLTGFYEADKSEGIFTMTYGRNQLKQLKQGDYRYASFLKSRDDNTLVYSQENFSTFPDLLASDLNLKKSTKISDINPQQKDYKWGSIELVKWNSLDGQQLEGMLVKPEDFDPNKKYPLIVNFYEKSSDRLNRHRDPFPGRSTINYSFYVSRGYIIFNPNVNYRTGYPGESAYNCVIPGVTSLIEKGFIDEENIAVQGHSWGGYQIAYLLSKTDMFKCAEAGAPVVNMISAYGGIRWGSGLSRMFQYERTQSRIGGTLWEYPLRYIENSPIFWVDKINTPVLIMHNDNDGAVPWYQGIEYFVALRRLGKPAWMLNYQGEPHWPVKVQNRIDFNIRLAQFFDYYLKGASKPKWMESGVPAIEVGINQGYELIDN